MLRDAHNGSSDIRAQSQVCCFIYSVLQYVEKPGDYRNEHQFMHDVYYHAMGCTRHYYKLWCVRTRAFIYECRLSLTFVTPPSQLSSHFCGHITGTKNSFEPATGSRSRTGRVRSCPGTTPPTTLWCVPHVPQPLLSVLLAVYLHATPQKPVSLL
jgi:hypothetical protein